MFSLLQHRQCLGHHPVGKRFFSFEKSYVMKKLKFYSYVFFKNGRISKSDNTLLLGSDGSVLLHSQRGPG